MCNLDTQVQVIVPKHPQWQRHLSLDGRSLLLLSDLQCIFVWLHVPLVSFSIRYKICTLWQHYTSILVHFSNANTVNLWFCICKKSLFCMTSKILSLSICLTFNQHSFVWLPCVVASPPGFPRLLEDPGLFFFKIPGPGKSWKITLVLESPGNWSLRSWKVLEKLLPPDVIFYG